MSSGMANAIMTTRAWHSLDRSQAPERRDPVAWAAMSIRHLDHLLDPASVAIVGASTRPGSVGATVWRNMQGSGFAGSVYPVNLKTQPLDGQRVYAQADELPAPVDLAIICTPPATVPGLIADFARAGTKAAIVMTAGLDAAQTQAVLDAARPQLLRVLGPNCIGLMTPHRKLNASFAHTGALAGDLAFVTQSGALLTAVLDWANARRIGFSRLVSLGQRIDVDLGDVLDYLASDPLTRAILLYVESIEAPRKFMSAARAASRNKPVIIVKAGRSSAGVKAAASHTGALAGSDMVFDAAFRRAGMLRVDTLQDLFMAAETLARCRGNTSDALTLMTNGGGAGVLAADAAARAGVPLAELGASTLAELDAALPATWSHGNPVDIIGDAPAQRYVDTLRALLREPANGAILFMHAPTAIVPSAEIAQACVPLMRESLTRVLSCWLGDAAVAQARQTFSDAAVPTYDTPEQAVQAFAMLRTYRRNQALLLEAPGPLPAANAPDGAQARELVAGVLREGRELLSEVEAKTLLRAYGIPVVATQAVSASGDDAVAAARGIGYPVALKILSPDITHKSDVGGVLLGLHGDDDVRRGAQAMLERVRAARPDARIDGFTVQAMVRRAGAVELIVGASIDSVFGPVVLFGHGGTAVEVIADRSIALPPLNRPLARELVSRTRVARLLEAYRDHPATRVDAVYDTLIALSQTLAEIPELAELDINPLLADEHGVIALDARVRARAGAGAGADGFAIRPYPAHLVETLQWQGRSLTLRPIRPEDEAQHRDFLSRLSPEDIRLRVFYSRREIERTELARLTQIDYAREMAFIAEGVRDDGQPETLGTVRAIADPDNIDAEIAIIVRSDLKGRGLGQLLFDKMIRYARAQGTQRLIGTVLHENGSMLQLARDNGFAVEPEPGGDTYRIWRAL
jgi:acetyltransferase